MRISILIFCSTTPLYFIQFCIIIIIFCNNTPIDSIEVCTDGSKRDGKVGGVAVYFMMEAVNCIETELKSKDIFILSDGEAMDCRRSLQKMTKQIRLSLIWVLGHRDIVGNCNGRRTFQARPSKFLPPKNALTNRTA